MVQRIITLRPCNFGSRTWKAGNEFYVSAIGVFGNYRVQSTKSRQSTFATINLKAWIDNGYIAVIG